MSTTAAAKRVSKFTAKGGREGFLLHKDKEEKIKRRGGIEEGFSLQGSWCIFKQWPGITFWNMIIYVIWDAVKK